MTFRILLTIVLAPVLCFAATQEEQVFDFSGGLVNSVANSRMQSNQALVLENYDIVPTADGGGYGELKRRKGLELHYPSGPIEAMFRYHGSLGKRLLLSGGADGLDTTIDSLVSSLYGADDDSGTCSALVYQGFHQGKNQYGVPYNTSFGTWAGRLLMAQSKSEMMVYDGTRAFPARPYGAGQPRVIPIDGEHDVTGDGIPDNHVNGRVSYRYVFIDTTADDTSNFSIPSWPVTVDHGCVYIYGLAQPIDTTVQDKIALYRSINGGNYEYVDSWNCWNRTPNPDEFCGGYIDTLAQADPADTLAHEWGPNGYTTGDPAPMLTPPGGLMIEIDTGTIGLGVDPELVVLSMSETRHVLYSVYFVDSAGRWSYMSPASYQSYGTGFDTSSDSGVYFILSHIPVVSDSAVTTKYLLRAFPDDIYSAVPSSGEWDDLERWEVVTTLPDTTTTYVDSIHSNMTTSPWATDLYSLDVSRDDSLIQFQPTDLAIHGCRCYLIGSTDHRDYLYYSEFGRPTTFALDHFLPLWSKQGDWLNGLYSIGNDDLLCFRQNSIALLSGLSFYQYRTDDITTNVGLTAPRSLDGGPSGVYFAHRTGVYSISSGLSPCLSTPIQNTVNKVGAKLSRSVGRIFGDEYWWTVPEDSEYNDETYIYSPSPMPHWRAYSFGFSDAILYDWDTAQVDFRSNRWVLALDNDSLYRSSDTATTDGGHPVIATYQSKYFFEGGGREKVFYVDLFGTGDPDSLRVIFYRNYGQSEDGQPFDTVIFRGDFSDLERDRVRVDVVCDNFSLRIEDFGLGDYTIRGYKIGYMPWDGGK